MYRPTRLEINLQTMASNVRLLRECVPGNARLMAVVKADGYGHGAVPTARTALANGADALAVAIPEEGITLREAGIDKPVLVLGGVTREGAQAAAEFNLEQTVFDAETVRNLEAAAARRGVALNVHLKVDTGMGRIGVRSEGELREVAGEIMRADHLRLTGVYTHFASADDAELSYTQAQNDRFGQFLQILRTVQPDVTVHASGSAALLRCPVFNYDMVRAGIAMYIDPGLPDGVGDGLCQSMRWVTGAVHVKEIEPGETVSYGRTFTAARPTRVMTLPVGYADGYHRGIGNRGRVLVRGHSAPVIGRVCMDQIMADVTDIPDVRVGDEVVLLGGQGAEYITVREMAQWCNMIDYEILLSPTARVPKVYV